MNHSPRGLRDVTVYPDRPTLAARLLWSFIRRKREWFSGVRRLREFAGPPRALGIVAARMRLGPMARLVASAAGFSLAATAGGSA